jgi:internalin A
MNDTPPLQSISESELESLISDHKDSKITTLVLVGPTYNNIPASPNKWPESWQTPQAVYRLREGVPALAERIATLTNILSLDLSCNDIGDEGAARLATLTQLKSLSLKYSNISSTGATHLASLVNLEQLDLQSNYIGDDGVRSLKPLTRLTNLNLWGNRLSAKGAECLAQFRELTSLILSYNKIEDSGAACLAELTNLTSLDLIGNEIGDEGVSRLAVLAKLKELRLSYNQIADVSSLSSLRNLEHLEVVKGNNLVRQPPEIVREGDVPLLNYLREIGAQGEDYLYEAKVLILGDGRAGKTSLLRRLYHPELPLPAEEETTKGIDIHRHEFSGQLGQPFRLNVWDFGGQQIYHATHQFFLTKRSLYVLLDDTRSNYKSVHDEGFKYWLEMIEALSEASPVLIFQNEKADRSKRIDEAGIKGRFPNVMAVHAGNLEHGDATAGLAEAIRYHVQQLPHVGEAVPTQWLKIRLEIDDLKQKNQYITQAHYLQLYEKHLPADLDKALKLSRYLHDLGVFLHFQDDLLLGRYVILQNEWATEAVFRALDDEPTKARQGYFSRLDCARIWSDSTYAEMHPELLALMEKFELCYKLPDQRTDNWLMPQLLSPSAPKSFASWAKADDLVLTYEYDFLPKGLISRLMVRMHRFVLQPDLCWGSGALFENGDTQLLASLASQSGQEIELRSRGPEAKALRDVIASDLDALNATFEGLRNKVRKLVPCICSQCRQSTNPARFDEPRLLKRKVDSKLSIECPDSYEDVSVLELLDGLRLDNMPAWAMQAIEASYQPDSSMSEQKTVKIFLASSSELSAERNDFELYLRQENDRLRNSGLYLKVMRWENFLDAMSETRSQDEYNKAVCNCDIFVSLFKTKTGKFTEEEFDVAHQAFLSCGKPFIYTYFMKTNFSSDNSMRDALTSLWGFRDKLRNLGHYPSEFTSIDDLQCRFRRQLDLLIEEGKI